MSDLDSLIYTGYALYVAYATYRVLSHALAMRRIWRQADASVRDHMRGQLLRDIWRMAAPALLVSVVLAVLIVVT